MAKIIKIEWEMFTNVATAGGRASCQEDRKTFEIMRYSQAVTWSEDTLASYLADLKEAEKFGRNLMTEKYARMMQSTAPEEYAAIEHELPPLHPETLSLIDKIMEIHLAWEEEVVKKYPHVRGKGRPTYSSEDTATETSLETYLRGELATYSHKTLQLYYADLLKQKSKNINGAATTLYHMIKQYGYSSLEEANAQLGRQRH